MHLFKVLFQTHYTDKVDMGEVATCAETEEQAIDLASHILGIPRSKTQFQAYKLKPPVLEIMRKQIDKTVVNARIVPRKDTRPAAAPPGTMPPTAPLMKPRPLAGFNFKAMAAVRAYNETQAMRLFSDAIQAKARGQGQIQQVSKLMVDCETAIDSKQHKTHV